MKTKVIAGIIASLVLFGIAGEAWSRVIVVPRRRVVVRPRPVHVYPKYRPRVVYYRYPAVKTIYVPAPVPTYYSESFPLCEGAEEVEIEIDVEVDD